MFTESTYENAVIQLFEGMGYTHIYAPEMGREDFSDPLMDGVLRDALVRINRGLPLEAIGEALSKIRNFDGGSLIEKNRTFTEYLQNGVEVNYAADGETRSALVRLVDFEKVENNKFAVVNQYTYIENGNNRRPDIILFVNGLPLVLMELKSPAKEDAGVEDAYNQLRNYIQDIPSMFIYNAMDIGKTAYPKFQEKLQVCRDLFHGYDFSKFYTGTPLEKAQAITGGVNFVLDAKVPKRKELFAKEALLLRQAQSLCSSMTTEEERHTAAYFEAVRSTVMKITMGGGNGKPLSLKEINSQISDLLKASIQSEGVINLFESAKMGEKFSLFDPSVLEEIARMKEKNIVVEILRKLMAEQIAIYKCTNVVQATTFSEKITLLMNTYYNGLITNEEVIKELLKTAEEINALRKEGEKLGLTEEELAFYDALTKPEHIKDFYENETLIALTRELTEMLRKNRTIDWQKKETARAGMRKMVKRLLKKYKYPPEKREDAIETVMSQCELWTDNMAE